MSLLLEKALTQQELNQFNAKKIPDKEELIMPSTQCNCRYKNTHLSYTRNLFG